MEECNEEHRTFIHHTSVCRLLLNHDVPRSKVAPRLASRVPKNRSDAPRNTRIVPGSIFAPRKDPAVPRNAETVPGNIHRPQTRFFVGAIRPDFKSGFSVIP